MIGTLIQILSRRSSHFATGPKLVYHHILLRVRLDLHEALDKLLGRQAWRQLALLGHLDNFFLFLALLNKHVIASLGLCTCISALDIFL